MLDENARLIEVVMAKQNEDAFQHATTHDAMLGLFRVQFFLLAPHAISVAAGLALSRLQPEAVPPHAGRLGSPRRPSTELGPVLRRAISGGRRSPMT